MRPLPVTKSTVVRGLRYYGGKSPLGGKSKWIVSILQWREKELYCEPFAGMLGVLLCRPKAKMEIVSDANEHIVSWWRAVRDYPKEMAYAIQNTPWSRSEYTRCYNALMDGTWKTALERAIAVHVVIQQGIMHGLKLDGAERNGWAPTYAPKAGSFGKWTGEEFLALHERIKDVQLDTKDANKMLERAGKVDRASIYCDPPYSETDNRPYGGLPYDRQATLDILPKVKGRVAISGYNDDWAELEGKGWKRHQKETLHRHIGEHSTGKATQRVEVLWTNF